MKKPVLWVIVLLLMVIFVSEDTKALSNGEIIPGRQIVCYNVQVLDGIKSLSIAGEWGLTMTLSAEGGFVYSKENSYLDLFLKFKLHENKLLDVSGRLGIHSDFNSVTSVEKTIGVLFTKVHNNYIKINSGIDYSMDEGDLGYFAGINYQLTSRTYFQAGWQNYLGSGPSGIMFGIQTDL
ncbi:MAG: hypothetical protein KAX49_00765 [Halanaerobiales bacterium]|nr:hypothetical protein [Halanaerobiales bacterium]